jgi:hypothetical protein
VTHLAVAHLPLRQTNKASAGVDKRVGIFGKHAVIVGFARKGNGVGFGGRRITPAIKDDENKRTVHKRQRILNEEPLPLINADDTDQEGIVRNKLDIE